MKARILSVLFVIVLVSSLAFTADEDGFVPLFNGKDLSGWIPVNVAPDTFTVQDGMIICSGLPTGVMRTAKLYENFIFEVEWRHMKVGGNSGIFMWGDALTAAGTPFARAIEVQVLDHGYGKSDWFTTHGDVFAIHGATMKPFPPSKGMRSFPTEHLSKGSPEWNHYRIECNNGTVKLSVNGKQVSGGENCKPRKGHICLESEGGIVHFRNLRIKELPSTGATAEETSRANDGIPLSDVEGFTNLYTGKDFAGWKWDAGHKGHWKAQDWVLDYDGKSEAADKSLWTEKEYGDFVLITDWRWTRKPVEKEVPVILPNGDQNGAAKVPDAGDSGIYLRGNSKSQVNIWCWPIGSGEVYGYRTDSAMSAEVRAGVTPKVKADKPIGEWNRFVITMKGDRLTVFLNGKLVIENAQLPSVPARGPIALQHHGDPIQFANILIKELK